MRDFKFRGKCLESGKWLIGSLVVFPDDNKHIICHKLVEFENPEHNQLHSSPVDPNTVGQFIELVGNNNTKIFEGDICYFRLANTSRGEVLSGVVNYASNKCSYRIDIFPFSSIYLSDIEVIGNVYDNPELLK